MITLIRKVEPAELNGAFLWDFDSYQCYHKTWEKQDGEWTLRRTSVVRQWNDDKKLRITRYLAGLVQSGGCVLGAFTDDKLTGFLALDNTPGGPKEQYRNLSMLFVDTQYRHRGVGRYLFDECVKEAEEMGAKKLFISSIPAEETVAFYLAMGCQDAKTVIKDWVDMPYDRHLEYTLKEKEEQA